MIYDVLDANGVIINKIELEPGANWTPPAGCTIQPDSGAAFGPSPNPFPAIPAVVPVISDRQFFQQLAIQSVITQDEALAAVKTGTLPASLVTLVSGLPIAEQFGANMLLCGATQFERSNPMVAVLATAFGWTSAQTDALWNAAALL